MASALAMASAWDVDRPRDFDAEDWWLRCTFRGPEGAASEPRTLCFGGLATLADVWLDGGLVLHSENMFLEHEVDVGASLHDGSELVLRFGALSPSRGPKRPRPRWRSTVVANQQLRWVRTALLGRMSAFHPIVAHVGAYRPVTLRTQRRIAVDADVKARVEGADGFVEVTLRIRPIDGARIDRVSASIGGEAKTLTLSDAPDASGTLVARGIVRLPGVELWWPHTHGNPVLHDVRATAFTDRGEIALSLGHAGFRSIEMNRANDGFGVRVNGVDVFCRGASWSPLDALSLVADDGAYRSALGSVRAAGMNMVRVSGATLYETKTFYDLCDELGLMVWQDFMFANMDYPAEDEAFRTSVRTEATQFLDRLQASPSVVVLCGNSEVAQQATMMGLAPSEASSTLFTEVLPALAQAMRPDAIYVETSPFGGQPPFRPDTGVSHYYGVGAYRRPAEDARLARVKFAAECLAFSNVPNDETIQELLGDGESATTGPRWKSRVPRDRGTSWDFEDVRDHYLRALFGADPVALRSVDLTRYLELSRVASGEVMAGAMTEWRRSGSECRGALVWMLRDLWPGAGWGIVDALGRPKAAYYFLKRVLQPVALLATDEGLNGLTLHAVNDTAKPIVGTVRLVLYRHGEIPVAEGTVDLTIPARRVIALADAAVLGRFVDATYAYRFGPQSHDLAVATLRESKGGAVLGRAFHFSTDRSAPHAPDPAVEAVAVPSAPGEWRVTVRTTRFARAVALDAPGFIADDDFFHIEPGGQHVVTLRGSRASMTARVKPLNAAFPTNVSLRG
jgi:beta-mannosidase